MCDVLTHVVYVVAHAHGDGYQEDAHDDQHPSNHRHDSCHPLLQEQPPRKSYQSLSSVQFRTVFSSVKLSLQ